jgi:phage terminase large subunit-like protein
LAAQNEAGNVALVLASWNDPFMTEAASFPVGRYKDQIDAASRGYSALIRRTREQETIAGPEVVIIEGVR